MKIQHGVALTTDEALSLCHQLGLRAETTLFLRCPGCEDGITGLEWTARRTLHTDPFCPWYASTVKDASPEGISVVGDAVVKGGSA